MSKILFMNGKPIDSEEFYRNRKLSYEAADRFFGREKIDTYSEIKIGDRCLVLEDGKVLTLTVRALDYLNGGILFEGKTGFYNFCVCAKIIE